MKNFKKLFSIVAIVAMMATAVPTATLGAASYSAELEGAYDYAYGIGATTQPSIETANMYGSLIRSHMAKMMTNYAMEVLGQTPDTTKECAFTDIANESAELQGYIKMSCQLGLMGVGISAFNPNGVVTRAQFGTVLSRALYGDAYNVDTNPYYSDHLQALKDAGIMTMISNPDQLEVRGYVMLMMQRADANAGTPAICTTPENVLSCSLGLDTCPAQCVTTPTEVKAGALTVSLNADSPANGMQIPSTGTIRFAVVNFAASTNDVALKTVEISKIGLASIPSSTRIWFEKDGIRISGKAAFSSEGKAILSFAPSYVVKAGSTEEFDLYVQLATSEGKDFQFASTSIGSTALNQNGSFTTPTLRTANYTVAPIDLTGASAGTTYNDISNRVELGAFTVKNGDTSTETRDVSFRSITLRQGGNGDITNLSNIILERNGVTVAQNPTVNSRDLTFAISDTIKDGVTATYYIKAMVDGVDNNAGDTYQFDIRNTTDVNAREITTSFRSTVTFANSGSVASLSLPTYTVQGGDISFTRDTSIPLSMNYAAGSEVVLMKGTITAKNAITLEDISALGYTGNYASNDLSQMFSTIYLTIGNSTFSYSPVSGQTTAEFLGTATIDGTAQVRMYGTLKDTANAYVKFNDLRLSSFTTKTYASNGNNVTIAGVGSIAGIQVTAQAATLNVTRNDGLGNTPLAGGSNGVTVYGLRLSSTQGNGVNVSNIVLNTAGYTTGYFNNTYLTLYINGVAIQSKTVTAASVTFDGFNKSLTATTPMDVVIKADFVEAFNTGTFQVTLTSLNAYDALTSNAITGYATPAGAVFTIGTAAGTLAISNDNPLAQLLLSPSLTKQIGAFKVTATNDGIRLYDVNVTGTNLDKLSNFRLTSSTGTVIATATTTTSTAVTFTQIANAPVIAKDTSASYYIVADVNSNTTGTVALTITTGSTNIKGSNGTTIAIGGANVTSNTHMILENTATLAMSANAGKLLTTSALRFTVTAAGKNSVELTGLNFNNLFAGYTTTSGQIVVYKTSIAAGNIAGSTSVGTVTGPVTLSANNVVDAGSTVEYVVALEGVIASGSANMLDWSVSLTNAYFGGIAAATYSNIGALPFTSVK